MTSRSRRPLRGFTLIEVAITSGLMVLLSLLLVAAWSGFGRAALESERRCRLAQEASLAAEALAHDLGGSLAGPAGRLGTKDQLRFVGRMQPAEAQLWLCFDGGPSPNGSADWGPPDTVLVYQLDEDALIRIDRDAGTTFTVARHVGSLRVQDRPPTDGQKPGVQVTLGFTYRDQTRSFTLIANDP